MILKVCSRKDVKEMLQIERENYYMELDKLRVKVMMLEDRIRILENGK